MSDTKIKICGLYREEDIEYVNHAMPDYAGFVFYEKSHRNVNPEKMPEFRRSLDSRIPAVGVFVDEPVEYIVKLVTSGGINIIQLHGQEEESYIRVLRSVLPKTEIWKAFKVRSMEDLRRAQGSSADKILLDNGYGTGSCFDWRLLDGIKRDFILAGGINAHNVREAIGRFRPECIDVSSSVETDKKKDEKKIREIVARIRELNRQEWKEDRG